MIALLLVFMGTTGNILLKCLPSVSTLYVRNNSTTPFSIRSAILTHVKFQEMESERVGKWTTGQQEVELALEPPVPLGPMGPDFFA